MLIEEAGRVPRAIPPPPEFQKTRETREIPGHPRKIAIPKKMRNFRSPRA